jgi:urea carboxylase
VAEGDRVAKGQPLVSLEAMKMETVLEAPCDGVVLRVLPAAGSQVVAGEAVVVLGSSDLALLEVEDLELEGATV